MLFNSLEFLVFFPVVTILYFLLPQRNRTLMLLIASIVFYMAFIPVYIFILFITILIDYFAGMWIERSDGKIRKQILLVSIVSTSLVLFVFKYFNFFNNTFASIAQAFGIHYTFAGLSIILPIGLSFHTFQSLSYVIEVYRQKQKAERDFLTYALYVMFYPQLVAGPIERPQNLLHQFWENHRFDYDRVVRGLQLMGLGFFKKVVIADRLAPMVNMVYNDPNSHNGIQALVATVMFAYQIYCDFSGYSDIAIGAAQVMGFKLMKNFERPYYSKSISEFWKRWHISLSTWFRDYVYIPLGGNRVAMPRWYFNLFITFLISGLWHGANWTFVIWGGLHGLYLIAAILTRRFRDGIKHILGISNIGWLDAAIRIIIVFALADFAWIFFRANTVTDAFLVIERIAVDGWTFFRRLVAGDLAYVRNVTRTLGFDQAEVLISLGAIAALEVVQIWQERGSVREALYLKPVWQRWAFYYVLVLAILFLGAYGEAVQFIYFQF